MALELPRRLLIVEDDPDLSDLLPMFFSHPLVVVEVAHDAESGIAAAWKERPHVILADFLLPGATGLAVLFELRRARFAPRIILMSAWPMAETEARVRRLGLHGYIKKPFDEAARDFVFTALGVDPADEGRLVPEIELHGPDGAGHDGHGGHNGHNGRVARGSREADAEPQAKGAGESPPS